MITRIEGSMSLISFMMPVPERKSFHHAFRFEQVRFFFSCIVGRDIIRTAAVGNIRRAIIKQRSIAPVSASYDMLSAFYASIAKKITIGAGF
jgi:hypothetical protein